MSKQWQTYAKRTLILETKYAPLFNTVIQKFRKLFIEDITTNGKEYATQRLTLSHINPELSEVLTSLYKEAGLFGASTEYRRLKRLINQKAANFGFNEFWVNEVINFLKFHLLRFVTRITETMRDDIIKILSKATEEGWSIDETVRELQRTDLTKARARVIARTEINRAANVGHSVGSKSIPFEMNKKWISAKDHRVRHSHQQANNQLTEEEGTFKVAIYDGKNLIGYDNMLYPGDATAHPSNTINCRCRIIHEPKRDAQGKLISRPTNTATVIPLQDTSFITPIRQIAATLKSMIYIGVEEDE